MECNLNHVILKAGISKKKKKKIREIIDEHLLQLLLISQVPSRNFKSLLVLQQELVFIQTIAVVIGVCDIILAYTSSAFS